ncbi:hypothetical protein GH714_008936 [Hevea brasiliensis]|uniref:Ionotropic glutamate receptor C-terminal domain-containing protein n=1 Tax=Hevea brasiliensis TaxID=3981 RepID=A0A6A6MJC7_HEVBR|nr:hypothetical protein GH714_008936 [Hevea brasiliensis]
MDIMMAQNTTISVNIGAVLDLENPAAKMWLSCINMALSDFYVTHSQFQTRLVLHTRDSMGDVVGAAAAALDLIKNEQVQAILGPNASMQANFVIDLGEKAQCNSSSLWMESSSAYYVDNEYGKGVIPYLTDALQAIDIRIPYRLRLDHDWCDDFFDNSSSHGFLQGILGIRPYVPQTQELENFKVRWKRKFQQVDGELNIYGLQAYDAATALAMAIEKAGDSTSVPKGWEIPTNGNKLRIGVPVKDGFSEFVKVTRDASTNTTTVKGYCIDVFDAVVKALPYALTYEYIPFAKPDGRSAGTYDDMVYHCTWSLTSLLTVQQLLPTVTDVNQLIKNGHYVGYLEGSFVLGLLKGLGFDESKLKVYSSTDECDELFSKGSGNGGIAAAFDEVPSMKLFLAQYCSKYTMIEPTFKTAGFGFAFPKGSPLVPDVSRAILNVKGDKMKEIEQAWFGKQRNCPDPSTSVSSNCLSLQSFWGLFLITGIVSVSALMIFTAMFVYDQRQALMPSDSKASVWSRILYLFRIFDQKDLKSHTFRKSELCEIQLKLPPSTGAPSPSSF